MSDAQIVAIGNIDPAKQYDVKLARPVTWGKHTFYPINHHIFSGRVLQAVMQDNPDDIYSSTAVAG
jgi:hypothetical protein